MTLPLKIVDLVREVVQSIPTRRVGCASEGVLSTRGQQFLFSLATRADNATASLPASPFAIGFTVESIASGAGISRRTGARAQRDLEALGLLKTEIRRPLRSRWTIVMSRLYELAKRGKAARDAYWQAVQGGAHVSTESGAPPRWLAARAHGLGVSTRTAWAMVQGVVAAVHGADGRPDQAGTVARSILRLWDRLGRPDVEPFLADVGLVARAARSAPGHLWADLRGQLRGPTLGLDRSRSIAHLCRTGAWSERLTAARQWAEASGAEDQPIEPDPPRASRGPVDRFWRLIEAALAAAVADPAGNVARSEVELERVLLAEAPWRMPQEDRVEVGWPYPFAPSRWVSEVALPAVADLLGIQVSLVKGRDPPR